MVTECLNGEKMKVSLPPCAHLNLSRRPGSIKANVRELSSFLQGVSMKKTEIPIFFRPIAARVYRAGRANIFSTSGGVFTI